MERVIDPAIDREIADRYKHIPGWGIDANPDDKPNYPMKHYTGADYQRLNYDRPTQQPVTVELLKSVERPSPSAVFGTVTPPEGISGSIRRYAFKYSESTYMHWVPLVLADRIGMIKGVIDDIKKGIFPNIIKERGWDAEWKYNKQGMIKNIAIGVAVGLVVLSLFKNNKRKALFG